MKNRYRAVLIVGALSGVLTVGACGTSESTPTSSSTSSTPHSASSSAHPSASASHVTTPIAPQQDESPVVTTPHHTTPHSATPPRTSPRDDDPAGHSCTDQNGAPGTYIWSDSSNQWVCQITGDAPRANPGGVTTSQRPASPRSAGNGGDPGGSPCTNQDGAHGTYIWAESTNQWVCQIG